jgi:beta-galactosidase
LTSPESFRFIHNAPFDFAAIVSLKSIPTMTHFLLTLLLLLPFDFDWQFHLGDLPGAEAESFEPDTTWQSVQLPHDWSIALDFDAKAGGSSGYLPGGIGLYRKTFTLAPADRGKQVAIRFDGIYHKATVYLNGKRVGYHRYGYTSFEYDLTPYLHASGTQTLFVRVDHAEESRWYTGSGIYRHAYLHLTDAAHLTPWGTAVTTPTVSAQEAEIRARVQLTNSGTKVRKLCVRQTLLDAAGQPIRSQGRRLSVTSEALTVAPGDTVDVAQSLTLDAPRLWDVDDPYTYTLLTELREGSRVVDSDRQRVGLRTFDFSADQGFRLNGRSMKLQGVCLHQDAGSLGVALPDRAIERRLRRLKEFGVNAIRCSHNPPAPELLTVCDTLGLLVIDEAFDKWKSGYYEAFFDASWRQDIGDMVRRDRNHPSVIVWSIGNELQEAWLGDTVGVHRARMLQDYVHRLDPTRPCILAAQQGFNDAFGSVTDLLGYNYMEQRMIRDHRLHPERKMLVTEAFPYYSGLRVDNVRDYVEYNPWNYVRDNDFIAGAFIWAGVDYIGEASAWPSVGWNSCPFDLTLLEKPAAAYLRTQWQQDVPMVRLMVRDNGLDIAAGKDHWQYPPMAATWNLPYVDGRVVQIRCVTTCDSVRLFAPHWNNPQLDFGFRRTADYTDNTIIWNQPYRPGKVLAIGYKDGREVCRDSLVTTGPTASFRLDAEEPQRRLWADGQDMAHVRITLLDSEGRVSKMDPRKLTVSVEGSGRLLGLDNGDMRRKGSFRSSSLPSYFGTALVRLQAGREAGTLRLHVSMEGVAEEQTLEFKVE